MVKTSEEMKNAVEEFIKITNINYEDQTEKVREKSEIIEWQFRVGVNVIVSKNRNRTDRIHIKSNYGNQRDLYDLWRRPSMDKR